MLQIKVADRKRDQAGMQMYGGRVLLHLLQIGSTDSHKCAGRRSVSDCAKVINQTSNMYAALPISQTFLWCWILIRKVNKVSFTRKKSEYYENKVKII